MKAKMKTTISKMRYQSFFYVNIPRSVYLRLRVFMEAALVGIVLSTVGEFSVVNVILATAVALDDANDDQEKDKEGKSEEHSNEPSCRCDAVVSRWPDSHAI
jgi:hypothetical protein